MKLEEVQWGFVGCGSVTEVKSGPAFSLIDHSRVVAVMRRNAIAAQDYARRHGIPRWYSNAGELIADPDVNAVYIATPPASHKEFALMALRAGKAVYVEKPMALHGSECDEMLAASERYGAPIFVAYYRRALPRFLKVQSLLAAGTIGDPRLVRCTLYREHDAASFPPEALPWRVRPELSGGGLFVDLASHSLDVLDFLFGPITAVSGHASSRTAAYPAEDTVSMSFQFANGLQGVGAWNFCSFRRHDEIEIVGSRGLLRFSTFGDSALHVESVEGTQSWAVENPKHIQQPLIESVVAQLRGVGRCSSSGVSASRTTRVIDHVLAAYRAG